MFNSLRGIIGEKRRDTVCLWTGGVEWELAMNSRDIDALNPQGGEARIWTWMSHRENEMRLFGFASAERRATFLELQKVEGIGPKAAQKIMGGISQEDLLRSLEAGDLDRLTAIPGLGKKTAQKMILTLKGKIITGGNGEDGGETSPYNELANALVEMGYDKKTALDALIKAAAEIPEEGNGTEKENAIFRNAILLLSR
ncbi:Holliday junction ATP-dependent DNA helicase RuvA [Spirochaetia bacterium]|nr:Holliday junction ATP-dependent DNA helicase RuvA [Spirochaetia bacterium]